MFVFVKNVSVGSKSCKVNVRLFRLIFYVDAEKGWIAHWSFNNRILHVKKVDPITPPGISSLNEFTDPPILVFC